MSTFLGILLLVTYLGFIYYAAKGGNLMLGLFVMAVIWSIIGVLGGVVDWNTINHTIFNDGPLGFGPTAINIMFGSWFGRILVETGIAGTIIRKAVELGGDKPSVTTILIAIVVSLIFTTSYGVGAVVAIGVIVFPILLSLGVSKKLATATYSMAVGCGLYFNSALLSQAAGTMVMPDGAQYVIGSSWFKFALVAYAVHMVAIIIMVLIGCRGQKQRAWEPGSATTSTSKNVTLLACLTPIIPVSLSVFGGISAIFAIIIAVTFALIATGNLKSWNGTAEIVQKTFHDGVADVGLVLGFLMFLQCFIRAALADKVLLAPIVSPIIPQSALVIFVIFGLFSFMSLFRGPLTIWGAGGATFALVAATGFFPIGVLFPLFYIQSTTITCTVCPTQSWNMWAIGYTKVATKDFMKQTLVYILPVAFILELIAYFMFAA
jgi:hypothetical protein